ncbi:unnamed protein product [Gongylonema pulchrum]|uniref:Spondin domain-containing protein n=1 Tax=Gongylonema pulchrum TaxID=637853 RepID=A0A183E3N9_9BILA|nr:unnamed protein product [Gongylonema pulchrum]
MDKPTLTKTTPSSKEELSPVPGSGEVEEASEDVPERMEVAAGEDTQELSDITDHENRSTRITSSTSLVIATWIKVQKKTEGQMLPCIYTYEPWSACSRSCWDGVGDYPYMTRKVNKSSIVRARGSDVPECDEDLENRVDIAPCNTFRSSFFCVSC